MIGDPSGHRWGGRRPGLAQTGVRRATVIDRTHPDHPLVQRQGLAGQRPAPTRQWGEPFSARRIEPVTVARRSAPPSAAPERSMRLSPHAAPQYPEACHAPRAGDSS